MFKIGDKIIVKSIPADFPLEEIQALFDMVLGMTLTITDIIGPAADYEHIGGPEYMYACDVGHLVGKEPHIETLYFEEHELCRAQ